MGLPLPLPSRPPLSLAPAYRPNPFMSVPTGITQMVVPARPVLMRLPPTPPPLNLSGLGRFFRVGAAIALPAAIVDLIGQAGAYKWRDNLLNQINGGNSNKIAGSPPFTGGQTPYAIYNVDVTSFIDATFRPNQHWIMGRNTVSGMGPIASIRLDYLPPSAEDSRHQWALIIEFGNYIYKSGFFGLNGAEDLNQFSWGVEDIVVSRADGQPDTGGDLQGAISGQDNTTPFHVPEVEPSPSFDPFLNPLKRAPQIAPPPVRPPQIVPPPFAPPSIAPPYVPPPQIIPPPQITPLRPPQITPPLRPPQITPPLRPPQITPPPPQITPPPTVPNLRDLIEKQRRDLEESEQRNREAQRINEKIAIQNSLQKRDFEDSICKQSGVGKCLDNAIKRNTDNSKLEYVNIIIKKFLACDKEIPKFGAEIISVLKGTEEANRKLFEELADIEALQCKPSEAYAAVPEWWQIRPEGKRPQLVLQFCPKLANGKYGAPKYSITLPHPKNVQKPLTAPLASYKKGNFEGELKLADSSKIIVNCETQKEAERVINLLKNLVSTKMLDGSTTKFSERRGKPVMKQEVFARIATYFEKGMEDSDNFKWKTKFNLP
jgi:hypothetical protein